MAISFAQLHFAEPSTEARRMLWHVLSIGSVFRDEPERRRGLDKAGLFLVQVLQGAGRLEVKGKSYPLQRGSTCWLVDLRHPRNYVPFAGRVLHTQGVRFSGPQLEPWLDWLGSDSAFQLPPGCLRGHLRRLREVVQRRAPGYEWQVHLELTVLWGELLATRRVFAAPPASVPAAVARVLEAVFAEPARHWQAQELPRVAGLSYSRLRDQFQKAQGQTLHEFLHNLRLDRARALLGDRRLSMKEVAERLQFSSEFSFSHFFRRAAGISPSEFRERCRS